MIMINQLGIKWLSMSLFIFAFVSVPVSLKQTKEVLPMSIDQLEKNDLKILMPVLHDIINFYLDSKNDIDLNLEYGMFLLNVVIKRLLEEREPTLPKSLSFSLKHLMDKNKELMDFFRANADHDKDKDDIQLKKILTLYSNESVWMSQLKKFDLKHRKKPVLKIKKNYAKQYKNLKFYEDLCSHARPTPSQADFCMRKLADIPINNAMLHKCQVPKFCVKVVYKGAARVGYALTHRLMMLHFTHFGRRCFFDTELKDRGLERRLCNHALQEAAFLTDLGYKHADLMFEQITFCALIGHFEFLKRSWLIQLMNFRTKAGCFARSLHHKERLRTNNFSTTEVPWTLNKDAHAPLLNGYCEADFTSGALTTVVLAVKYLLEAFY